MKNKFWNPVVLASLTLLLLSGCGVAQQKYDTALSDLKKAQDELQATNTELQSAKADSETLQAKLSAATSESGNTATELQAAKADAVTAKAQTQAAQSSLSALKTVTSRLNPKLDLAQKIITYQSNSFLYNEATRVGNTAEQTRLRPLGLSIFKTFDDPVAAIGDSELSRSWGEAWSTGARQQSEASQSVLLSYTGMSKFLDRLTTLIKTDSDALQAAR